MKQLTVGMITVISGALFIVVILAMSSTSIVRYTAIGLPTGVYTEGLQRLPGFNPLYNDSFGNNCEPSLLFGCARGANYSQVPVLSDSPEQPEGIYYIDNSSDLVRVPLHSNVPLIIAHVTLLSDRYGAYAGMTANDFFLPDGYDEALLYGIQQPKASALTVETVNLTTGKVILRNTGIAISPQNQQVTMISPEEVFIASQDPGCGGTDCSATFQVVNLTTGETHVVAQPPFFEANNLYWVPGYRLMLNIEAHGATGDQVEQWDEDVGGFFLASTVRFSVGMAVMWVDGVAFNGSAVAFSAGGSEAASTFVLPYYGGILSSIGELVYPAISANGTVIGPDLIKGQQYTYTSNWVIGSMFDGKQYLFDPWTGEDKEVNDQFTNVGVFSVCDGSCFLGQQATGPGLLIDWNATLNRNDPFWSVVVAWEM